MLRAETRRKLPRAWSIAWQRSLGHRPAIQATLREALSARMQAIQKPAERVESQPASIHARGPHAAD